MAVDTLPCRPDRLLPAAELPAYTFVPGTSTPHPAARSAWAQLQPQGPNLTAARPGKLGGQSYVSAGSRLLQRRLLLGSPRGVGAALATRRTRYAPWEGSFAA